jgi:hypothetical protein
MGFAGAGPADEDRIALGVKEGAGGEFANLSFINRRIGEERPKGRTLTHNVKRGRYWTRKSPLRGSVLLAILHVCRAIPPFPCRGPAAPRPSESAESACRTLAYLASRLFEADVVTELLHRFVPGERVQIDRIEKRPVDVEDGCFGQFQVLHSGIERTGRQVSVQVDGSLGYGWPNALPGQQFQRPLVGFPVKEFRQGRREFRFRADRIEQRHR